MFAQSASTLFCTGSATSDISYLLLPQAAYVSICAVQASLLFADLPDCLLDKLQIAQNHAACIVFHKQKADHVTLLCDLHWLPIRACIKLKIIILCCSVVHGLAPVPL